MNLTLDCSLPALPLRSVAVKRRLSRRYPTWAALKSLSSTDS
jgi:hypothetical protein